MIYYILGCLKARHIIYNALYLDSIHIKLLPLRWRLNGRDSVSNHQLHGCLLNRLFRRRWKKTSKLRVTGLCEGNSPGTGEFPAQMASYAESVFIWWRHHVIKWYNIWQYPQRQCTGEGEVHTSCRPSGRIMTYQWSLTQIKALFTSVVLSVLVKGSLVMSILEEICPVIATYGKLLPTLIARFMGPIWGPSGDDKT